MDFADYVDFAPKHAQYEKLSDEEGWYGEVPQLPGVWGNANTLEECERELRETIEGWVKLGLDLHHPLPRIDDVGLAAGRSR